MNNLEPIIEWKPWKDVIKAALNESRKKQDIEDYDNDGFEKLSEPNYFGPVMQTSLGIFPINETNLPSAVFNFWRGDTFFPLTKRMCWAIINTLGVETFNQYTPYRFRIAVAKRFNQQDVCNRIDNTIRELLPKLLTNTTDDLYQILHKQYEFFAVIEDSVKKVISGQSKEEVEEKLKQSNIKPNIRVYLSWKQ